MGSEMTIFSMALPGACSGGNGPAQYVLFSLSIVQLLWQPLDGKWRKHTPGSTRQISVAILGSHCISTFIKCFGCNSYTPCMSWDSRPFLRGSLQNKKHICISPQTVDAIITATNQKWLETANSFTVKGNVSLGRVRKTSITCKVLLGY